MKDSTQEVEIRALLPNKDESFNSHLVEFGAIKIKEEIIEDWYYCPISVTHFSEIEMKEKGSYSLRIRKKTPGQNQDAELNVKKITQFDDHNSWEEREVVVSSAKEMDVILRSIGFKVFFTLKKNRIYYRYNDMVINLELISGLGYIIEVEIMTTKEKSETAKAKIKKFLNDLNIDSNNLVPKSITNILMQEHSKF